MGIKRIVLVTTGQPSVNPRIVKEADALQASGYDVIVLYCFWIKWAIVTDGELLKKVKWRHQLIGGSPSYKRWQYFYSKLRLKINGFLNKKLGNKRLLAERCQARCYNELLKAATSIKADWYIGHNLGALPIVVKAAKYHNAKSGFDFEDYHREELDNISHRDLNRIIYLENKYVPHLHYVSTSSMMITDKVKADYHLYNKQVITLLNCFPLSQQPPLRNKSADDNTLQLFWFSQTVGKNRGLEILFNVLEQLNDKAIHVTIAGIVHNDLEMYIDNHTPPLKNNIHFAGIIPPGELPSFAANFDAGLALELDEPNNRNICLTNKIFTYLLAGNAVILSATQAQLAFNHKYKIGNTFEVNNAADLKRCIISYKNILQLEKQRLHNYELARHTLNWESESKKLLAIID